MAGFEVSTEACALGDARRQAWVSLFKGQLAWWIGVSPTARDFAEHAERTGDASDDRSLRITAGLYAGFAWCHDGDGYRANRCLEMALDLLRGEPVHRRHGHQSLPVPMALAHLARSHALLGNVAEAVRHGREALRLAEEVGHRYSVMTALGSLGDVLMTRGELDEAISMFERFAALAGENEVGVHVTASLGYALVLSGRVIEAAEALRIGLVDRVVPPDRLVERVEAEIERFTSHSAAVLRLSKRALRESLDLPFDEALASLEAVYQYELMVTADAQEGLRAFSEKRKPVWRDR